MIPKCYYEQYLDKYVDTDLEDCSIDTLNAFRAGGMTVVEELIARGYLFPTPQEIGAREYIKKFLGIEE